MHFWGSFRFLAGDFVRYAKCLAKQLKIEWPKNKAVLSIDAKTHLLVQADSIKLFGIHSYFSLK